jgi:hypothetical protein
MSTMNYLERKDAEFIEQAADDIKRKAAIERLTEARRWAFWRATVLFAGFIIVSLGAGFSDRNLTSRIIVGLILLGVTTVLQGMDFMKRDSDLRLLKLVDKLKR